MNQSEIENARDLTQISPKEKIVAALKAEKPNTARESEALFEDGLEISDGQLNEISRQETEEVEQVRSGAGKTITKH